MRTHRRSHFVLICFLLCGSLSGQKIWTLSECIDTALEQNIQIQQTAIQERSQKNTIDTRWGGIFPQLNASAGYNWNFGLNIDPVTNVPSRTERQTNSLSLNASWTLFNGLQNYNNLAQARLDRMVRVYQVEDMKNNTALSVASQYVQILLNQEILKIADEQARVTQLQLLRMKQLVDAGARPKGDQLQLEAQRARDEQSFVSAQNNLRISRLILAQTMQIPNGEDLEVAGYAAADPESGLLSMSPQDIYTAALGNQPSIKASELTVQSAEKGVALAKGAVWPSLSIFAAVATNYSDQVLNFNSQTRNPLPIGTTASGELVNDLGGFTFQTDGVKPFGDQYADNINQFIGLNLSIPIWTGFQLRNGIRNARLNQEQSKLQLEDTKNQLRQTIERAHADARSALETYASAKSNVRANQEAFDYAELRFQNGVISQYDYENARNGLSSAQAQMAQAKYDFIFRIKTLEFYLNGSIQP